MKYYAVVAIMDGVPDSSGDILTENVDIPQFLVPVSNAFSPPVIGQALITKEGHSLTAKIEIDESRFPTELIEQMTGVVGGTIIYRNGPIVDKWKVTEVGLTREPSDNRLPKLKRIEE